jgi:hypothetical protein
VNSTTPRCRIVYDDEWRPELVEAFQRDTSTEAMQRVFEELADTLGGLVDRPDEVSLVVAVGLASAVQRREPGTGYHTERGTGTVAARTMKRADGTIDVIIETGFLADVLANGQPVFTATGVPRLSRRGLAHMKATIIHEAQHAIMDQRDSGYEQFELSVHAGAYPSWDYAVAAMILDEYRAEWNAAQAADRQPPSMSDVLDVLEHLGVELAAANVRYQRAPTPAAVATLLEDVYSACAAYWTWMAYWAAPLRGNGLELAAEIEDLKLWKRYVGPTWTGLIQALDDTPVEDLGTLGDMLRGAAASVANWVSISLQHIGFRNVKDTAGEAFYIDRFDFPVERS